MAFQLNSSPYSTTSREEDASFPFALPAGPDAWPYPEVTCNLQTMAPYLPSESSNLWEPFGHAPPMPISLPPSTCSYPEGDSPFTATTTGNSESLYVLTDLGPFPFDDTPALTTATDAASVAAISPEDFRSPVQLPKATEAPASQVGTRRVFPIQSVAPLREWFNQNLNDPYPSKETKAELAQRTRLTFRQVNHWFINARKRFLPRSTVDHVTSGASPMPASPDVNSVSGPDSVLDEAVFNRPFGLLSPLSHHPHDLSQRPWLSPGPPLVIPEPGVTTAPTCGGLHPSSSAGSDHTVVQYGFNSLYAPAVQATSYNPSGPDRTPSSASAQSLSSHSEVSPVHRYPKRRGVRRTVMQSRSAPGDGRLARTSSRNDSRAGSDRDESDDQQGHRNREIFQCTFPNCGKTFSSKTWKRHEETKHLPRFQWTCMATGFIVPAPPSPQTTPNPTANPFVPQTTPLAARTMCAFCNKRDPDPHRHPQECPHRLADCLSRPHAERTFSRKDHLFQHLRNFHRMTPPDGTFGAAWKSKVEYSGRSWGCGFCGERLSSWERRARHLRGHFREGWRVETGWNDRRTRLGPAVAY